MKKKIRIIEVPMIDFVKDLWFDTGDHRKNVEHFLGTSHAYMDRTKEKVLSIEPMLNKSVFRVRLVSHNH